MYSCRRAAVVGFVWTLLVVVALAQQAGTVFDQIPGDVRGIVVLRDVGTTLEKVDALAARFGANVPKLTDLEQGVDTGRNVALAWLDAREGDEQWQGFSHFVLLLPVKDYAAFLGQFEVTKTEDGVAETSFGGQDVVVAKKADYAIVAQANDRAALAHVMSANSSIAPTMAPLRDWMNQNDLTVALSPSGTKLLFDKLKEGVEQIKAGAAAAAEGNAEVVAAGLGVYSAMFDVGAREFEQFAIGLRVKPETSVEVHKRALLKSDGSFAQAASSFEAPAHPMAQLPKGRYVMAFAGVLPTEWSRGMMQMSFSMLQAMGGPDAKDVTPEQVSKLSEVTARAMQGVKSMAFVMGVGPGEGIYSHTSGTFAVDDAQAFMQRYEEAIREMSRLMAETGFWDGYQVERVDVDGMSVLRLDTDLSKLKFGGIAGAPDMEEQYKKLFGPDGRLSVYLAPSGNDTIVMAYTSVENLKRALQASQQKQLALVTDTDLQKTAQLLPASAQWTGYLSPAGTVEYVRQMATIFVPNFQADIPKFKDSPPIGMAAELTPSHFDGRLVVPMATIDAVLDFVQQVHQAIAANNN